MSFTKRNAIRAKFDAQTLDTINMELVNLSWNKDTKSLMMQSWEGTFPDKIFVRSHHTGKVVCFIQDKVKAYESEFWDGELMEYHNMSNDQNVIGIRLVLTRF